MLPSIATQLANQGIDASVTGDTLEATWGLGRRKRSLELDASSAAADLGDDASRELVAAYARGLGQWVTEADAAVLDAWTFVETAGRLVPYMDHQAFVAGYQRAGGQAPWVLPWSGDLVVTYAVELDHGNAVVTEEHVAGWNVSDDRITCAGRSLLYHKTGWDAAEEADDGALAYRLGDGYDATRALILRDLDYQATRRGLLVGMPAPGLLLTRRCGDDTEQEAFVRQVREAFASSTNPLSPHVFVFRDSATPERLEAT